MKQKLLLLTLGLAGFLVASIGATILQMIVGGFLPNNQPDPPGEMMRDPVREATAKSNKPTATAKPQQQQEAVKAAPEETTSAPAPAPGPAPTPAPAPAPAPAPPPPVVGPGNMDVPHTYYPSAPATGPGNL
jgi:hypothetical protein